MRLNRSFVRFLLPTLFSLISGCFAYGQVTAVTNSTSTPIPGTGHNYIQMLNETVNPANGAVSLRVQVPVPRGRGFTLPFAFAYNSNGPHFVVNNGLTGGEWRSDPGPISQGGWSYSVPLVSYTLARQTYCDYEGQNCYTCDYTTNYLFQDSSGGRHNLGIGVLSSSADNRCSQTFTSHPNGYDDFVFATTDNDGLATNVYDLDGTLYSFSSSWLPSSVEDRNGNKAVISDSGRGAFSITDTLGRLALSSSGFGTSGNTLSVSGLSQPYTVSWGAASSNFTLGYAAVPGAACYVPNGFPSHHSETQPVITAIALPNGTQYQFTYESIYGLLHQVAYPTGGWVKYDWGINPQSEYQQFTDQFSDVANCIIDWFAIRHRYVSFDGTNVALQQDFDYSTTWNQYSWTSKQTIVTTRDLIRGTSFTTTYVYASSGIGSNDPFFGNPAGQMPIEQTVTYKDSGGQTLRTVTKSWFDPYLLQSEQETLDNGLVSKKSYNYVQSYGQPIDLPNETDDYDYAQGSPGALLRKTITNYASFPSTPMGGTILDRPCQVVTYDSSGTNVVAETDYFYDGTTAGSPCSTATTQALPGSGNYTGHDETLYGTSSTAARGNATTITRKCLQSCSNSVTTYAYDETGQRLTMTDPNLHTTSYSYTDSYSSGTPPGPTNAYLTTVTYPQTGSVSHIEHFAYAYASGEVTSSTDQNNLVTAYKYIDNLARLTETDYPDGGVTSLAYNDAAYNPSTPSPSVTATKKINATTNLTTVSAMNGLGQVVRSERTSDPSGTTYTDITRDGLGRVWKQSNPYRTTGDSTYGITTNYFDALGRTCLVVPPDGTLPTGGACPATQPSNTIFTTYSTNTTTVTDQAGKSRKSVVDGLGRLSQVFEDPAGINYETDYGYDTLGNLLCVGQKGTNSGSFTNCTSIPSTWRPRTFTYDSLSRLLCASNPENSSAACPATATASYTTGTTGYAYDAGGNLSTKTALAPNQTGTTTVITSYSYDALNRLTQKSYNDSGFTPTIKYGYDAVALNGCSPAPPTLTDSYPKPLRTAMCDGAGAESWSHDVMGRVLTDSRTTNSLTKSTVYTYLPYVDGSVYTVANPSGRTLTYATGAAERLLSVQDNSTSVYYASSALYAPQGALSSLTNGPNLYSTHIYNTRLQPCWLYTTTGTALATSTPCTGTATTGNILDFKFNFNLGASNNGNVAGITNNRDTTRSITAGYDSLNRVSSTLTTSTHSTSPANCWGETYSADAWGNLQTIAATTNSNYTGCVQESGFNFTNFIGNNNRITYTGYGYDSPGNLNSGIGVSGISYNAENQLVTSAGVTYKYDGDGKRVQKSSGKLYWYGDNGAALDETDLSGNLSNEYVFFGGQRIARRDPSNNVFYYFTDHLGTSRTMAQVLSGQSTSTLCYDADFYPFGVERTPIVNTCSQDYKFTGKERDSESGLDNFGARYDASSMGRFMTPDPLPWLDWQHGNKEEREEFEDFIANPQNFNMYSYVNNNPLNKTDPTGMKGCLAGDKKFETCTITIVYDPKTSKGTITVTGQNKGDKDPTVLLTGSVVVGGDGHVTPTGTFTATTWEKDHVSTKYGSWADTKWSDSWIGKNVFGPFQLHIGELEKQGIWIHGTLGPSWSPTTWGNTVVGGTSHGCIRLCNQDDIALHNLMPNPRGNQIIIKTARKPGDDDQ